MSLIKLLVTLVQAPPAGLAKGKLQKKFPWGIQYSRSYCKGEKINNALSAPSENYLLHIINIFFNVISITFYISLPP